MLSHLSSISMRTQSSGHPGFRRGAFLALVMALVITSVSLAGGTFVMLASIAMGLASRLGQEHELVLSGAHGEVVAFRTRSGHKAQELTRAITHAVSEAHRHA